MEVGRIAENEWDIWRSFVLGCLQYLLYNGSEYLEQARAAEADSTPVCSKYPE